MAALGTRVKVVSEVSLYYGQIGSIVEVEEQRLFPYLVELDNHERVLFAWHELRLARDQRPQLESLPPLQRAKKKAE